jgi:ParB family chromosome partitioning protein
MIKQINVEKLSVSENNVRKSSVDGLDDLADNIKEMIGRFDGDGLIHPLTVSKDDNKKGSYKVIAGQRRLAAIGLINEKEPGLIKKVKCLVVDADDSDQTMLSLAENSFSAQMDPLDRHAAYSAMVDKGKSIESIAQSFGTTSHKVKQSLAISSLDESVIVGWKEGVISDDILYRLTTYPVADQKKVMEAVESGECQFYYPQMVDNFLKRAPIDIEHALFDVEKSGLTVLTDLFKEEQFVEDSERFMELQRKAVNKLMKDTEKLGITCIFIDSDESHLSLWGCDTYEDIAELKDDFKGVYQIYKLDRDGEVLISLVRFDEDDEDDVAAIHELKVMAGLIEPKEENVEDDVPCAENSSNEPEKPKGRQELSANDQLYFRNWQQLFVSEKLAENPDYSHRLMLTMLIMGHGLNNSDRYGAHWENLEFDDAQFSKSPAKAKVDKLVKKYKDLIRRKYLHGDEHRADFIKVLKTIMEFDAVQIQELMTVIAIMGINPTTGILNLIGEELNASDDLSDKWQPDEGFFNALSSNPALMGVAEDVAKTDDELVAFNGMKIKDKRAKLAEMVADDYKPKYLQFPAQRYGDIELDIETTRL